MSFLDPADLHPATVFPQATDNQLVPAAQFKSILKKRGNLSQHTHDLDAVVRRELNRSLIYSPTAVINRASFVNTRPLTSAYARSAPKGSVEAAAKLLESRALVPMLFGESSFSPDQIRNAKFAMSNDGLEALDHLLDSQGLGSVDCFRPDATVLRQAPDVFRNYFNTLAGPSRSFAETLAAELFGNEPRTQAKLDAFRSDLQTLGRWFIDECDRDRIDREDVYKTFLIRHGGTVDEGDYGNPRDLYFPYLAKLLVDLRYVSNIPDQIGRITFTPEQFPSRTALQDFTSPLFRNSTNLGDLAAQLGQHAHELLHRAQAAYTLPALEDLDFPTIVRIRESSAWQQFSDLQRTILTSCEHPEKFLAATQSFPDAFESLQKHIQAVAGDLNSAKLERRLRPTVGIAISLGTGAFTYWITGNPATALAGTAVANALDDTAWPYLKGLAIKLLLKFEDEKTGVVDEQMSCSIESLRSDVEITRDEVRQLIGAAENNAEPPATQNTFAELDNV